MAKNIKIEGAMPELYQASTRPVSDIVLTDLEGKSEPFGGFSAEVGDVWLFPAISEAKFKKQRVQSELRNNEKPTYVYFISGVRNRNGVSSNEWFSLNFLAKTDVNRIAVNPTWYSLGDAKAKAEKLCEMGKITVLEPVKIDVPIFQGGRPSYVPTLDPVTKEQVVDEYGTARTHIETRKQDAYKITPAGVTPAE